MKFNIITVLISVVCIQLAVHNHNMKEIEVARSKVLVDQINDMGAQLSELRALPSYEDGVRDGVENRQDVAYMKGYHMATNHMSGIITNETGVANNE